jgi:flagellar biosynthesis chaperone FliJ
MSRDPLATLLKLRALEVATARRDLAERRVRAEEADRRAAAAEATIAAEVARPAEFADSLVAWLPLARGARDRALGEARLAEQAVEAARSQLAAERARARVVEWLMEKKAAEARAKALKREQAALDEAAQRVA